MPQPIHPEYPTPEGIDSWCDELISGSEGLNYTASVVEHEAPKEAMPRHTPDPHYVRFEIPDQPVFYGYWQPVQGPGPAPLLLHVPGYGAEMSAHPELVQAGYNVLHINPLGYCTPDGYDLSKQVNDFWPVLPDTAASEGKQGYVDWLSQALVAARWAVEQDSVSADRVGCFGTSQGGGGSLLLGSLLKGKGVRAVAADLPFLTNFPLMATLPTPGAYGVVLSGEGPSPGGWRGLGFIDTLSHAHRLNMPVMLTAAKDDEATPPASIEALFDRLPGIRSYTEMEGGHCYRAELIPLATAWFRLYL